MAILMFMRPLLIRELNRIHKYWYISGGDRTWREFVTLPNILKNFNPNLYGYSTGVTRVFNFPTTGRPGEDDGFSAPGRAFNLAETGAESDDILLQAENLVKKMSSDIRVDFQRDWKMITVLVGHNDICSHACQRMSFVRPVKNASPRNFASNVAKALDVLHKNVPRAFVNLLPVTGGENCSLNVVQSNHDGICFLFQTSLSFWIYQRGPYHALWHSR